jgi:hypothetical protein
LNAQDHSLPSDFPSTSRLDAIGIAAFSHDFKTLDGKHSDVQTAFEAFAGPKPSYFEAVILLLSLVFPIMERIPTKSRVAAKKFNACLENVARKLLADLKKTGDQKSGDHEKSILGLLCSF